MPHSYDKFKTDAHIFSKLLDLKHFSINQSIFEKLL